LIVAHHGTDRRPTEISEEDYSPEYVEWFDRLLAVIEAHCFVKAGLGNPTIGKRIIEEPDQEEDHARV
jgi:hypothetical protein